jgi:3-hydroxyacyl-CoA dehydrogenase/enoyl-CoA hydratase/3-hydroxybutyryl-CoA epimerase/enoyl-CoA isomerase
MGEAAKLLDKQVSKGALTTGKMAETLGRIRPTLTYGDFKDADFVVEAVVENEKIKLSVLAEVEAASKPGAVIASNTSTISIDCLAQGMKHPENFCGMHFFNPVHRMPLVEIIRGKKTSDATIARTVQFAQGLGKTPIVVNDCPGFLVNRVLFPYFSGFQTLLADGVDFQRIDRVMEKFGWPMGPAYLLDVVGIDTAVHADRVMAAGFPDRMAHEGKTAIEVMVEAKRFGQKNGVGFYKYTPDKKGPPKKEVDPSVMELLKSIARRDLNATITDEQIIDRMMLPMLVESARCLEEGIVGSPMETDIALLFGLGFPPFRGGIFRHADTVGLKTIVEKADAHREFGKLYAPTDRMREMAKSGKGFYPSL